MHTHTKEETQKILDDMTINFNNGGRKITVPPPIFVAMKAEILSYTKGKSITVAFPVSEDQTNPMGMMQGGVIAAAFDNAFGPLSYLVAKRPTTTIDMNIQYIRGVAVGQKVIVKATVEAKGFSTIHMVGEMRTEKDKLLATATTNLLILKIPGGLGE
ncbi:PaaI family thioesterase [Leptospira montravelensis]|uniref:PaaI family thioesterase n=1 Tax=Leptospira montravelensis TaxID=2484961 RepID=A0ABY2LQ32_9LEPT|nr:PaaI family thioesterase [Leptospira montravelensis]TGK86171.1 PaaI family thioesterase [Leptospira montravelensis]TGK95048.1 PaaI family thioesterase [Leptospira montravelensis]